MADIPVKVIRSRRRRKTVSAGLANGVLIIRVPDRISKKEEIKWVERMQDRLDKKSHRVPRSDEALMQLAENFNKKYFNGELSITSITYSKGQRKRHGSCNTLTGCIRISNMLLEMPKWVLDYVIVHELAHLVYAGHSALFWELVNRYKYTERARGFLIAKDMGGDKG